MSATDTILSSTIARRCNGKRYFPSVGDIVVGVIVQKTAEQFKVDIGSSSPATLSNTAFNSASKRHRPNLKLGQVVVCHVVGADKNLDSEVSCEDPTSQKDWVTNEVYFGALPEGGLLIDLPVRMGVDLVAKNNNLFTLLGQYLKPFEVAIGVNGKVYIKTTEGDHLRAIMIADVIRRSDKTKAKDLEELCQEAERKLRH